MLPTTNSSCALLLTTGTRSKNCVVRFGRCVKWQRPWRTARRRSLRPACAVWCTRAAHAARRLSKRGYVAQDRAVKRVTGLFAWDLAKFKIKFMTYLKLDTESHSTHFNLF